MIPYQNCEVYVSFIFYLVVKFVCIVFGKYNMYRQSALSSIPENDVDEEFLEKKWVPKKKHEILKAKYKCLKKLFQIYDASVINGILPEPEPESIEEKKKKHRRKRSHRTKTDACSGTNGDNTSYTLEYDESSVSANITDKNMAQAMSKNDFKIDKYAETIDSHDCHDTACECCNCHLSCQGNVSNCQLNLKDEVPNYPRLPYCFNERRKLTRFQCFVQRLFGIRRESYNIPDLYASSDPTLTNREKRRRRGLRFRRIKRAKKIKSDSALKDLQSSSILSHVQLVHRYCLMDTTPRQCPIVGCNMISYGIINYNDHLNLCHFKDRKYICHYCHEGFEKEADKLSHENEHIGLTKYNSSLPTSGQSGQTSHIASDTQTDPEMKISEDKLKKIVSFFDQISDPNQILNGIKTNGTSESNLVSKIDYRSHSDTVRSGNTHTYSCCNIRRRTDTNVTRSSAETDVSSRVALPVAITCRYCGEKFKFRRQLSLHMDLEHNAYNKFNNYRNNRFLQVPRTEMISEDGSINVRSANQSTSRTESLRGVDTLSTVTEDSVSRRKSDHELSCDPSTNIVYCTSVESLRKPSVVHSLVNKVRSYRWEPGTKIIRV